MGSAGCVTRGKRFVPIVGEKRRSKVKVQRLRYGYGESVGRQAGRRRSRIRNPCRVTDVAIG